MTSLGIGRLLGVVGRHLEAYPGPEGHEDADSGGTGRYFDVSNLLRRHRRQYVQYVERVHIEAGARAGRDNAVVEERQNDDFQNEGNAQDARREAHVEVAEQATDADGD